MEQSPGKVMAIGCPYYFFRSGGGKEKINIVAHSPEGPLGLDAYDTEWRNAFLTESEKREILSDLKSKKYI